MFNGRFLSVAETFDAAANNDLLKAALQKLREEGFEVRELVTREKVEPSRLRKFFGARPTVTERKVTMFSCDKDGDEYYGQPHASIYCETDAETGDAQYSVVYGSNAFKPWPVPVEDFVKVGIQLDNLKPY